MWIPGEVGGRRVRIKTEVVERDVPWIIGKDWMERWGMVIDVGNTEVKLGKLRVGVGCTIDDRGHMRLVLRKRKKQGWWENGWMRNKEHWKRGARKLHLQFRHRSKEKTKDEKKADIEGCKKEVEKM